MSSGSIEPRITVCIPHMFVQTICNCFVADIDRIEQHWSSRKKTGVPESGRKLAITAFDLSAARGKVFSTAFLFAVFLNLAIILRAGVFASILKTAPIWLDCKLLTNCHVASV